MVWAVPWVCLTHTFCCCHGPFQLDVRKQWPHYNNSATDGNIKWCDDTSDFFTKCADRRKSNCARKIDGRAKLAHRSTLGEKSITRGNDCCANEPAWVLRENGLCNTMRSIIMSIFRVDFISLVLVVVRFDTPELNGKLIDAIVAN